MVTQESVDVNEMRDALVAIAEATGHHRNDDRQAYQGQRPVRTAGAGRQTGGVDRPVADPDRRTARGQQAAEAAHAVELVPPSALGGPRHEPTELFAQNESPSWQPTRAVTKKPDLPRLRRRPRKRRSSSAAEGAPAASSWSTVMVCSRPGR